MTITLTEVDREYIRRIRKRLHKEHPDEPELTDGDMVTFALSVLWMEERGSALAGTPLGATPGDENSEGYGPPLEWSREVADIITGKRKIMVTMIPRRDDEEE